MKARSVVTAIVLLLSPAFAQKPDLSGYHSILTTDCRNIRGHAGRIVAEASEPNLNKDVAAAHLAQVAKFHHEMESTLKESKEALTAKQRAAVQEDYASLERTCTGIGDLLGKLQAEFAKGKSDSEVIRGLASKLRNQMSSGYEVHEQLKKKLGLR